MTTNEPTTARCSLAPADIPDRLREWRDLRTAATEIVALPSGVRLVLPLDLAEAAADLAERERSCCSFLVITMRTGSDRVELDIRSSDPDGRSVIAELSGIEPIPAPVICCS